MGNMLYWVVMDVTALSKTCLGDCVLKFATFYRFASLYSFLIIITIFIFVDFDEWKIPSYKDRRSEALYNNLGVFVFIYCWISSIVWPISLWIVNKYAIELSYTGRDPLKLVQEEQWQELQELMQFGCKPQQILVYRFQGENVFFQLQNSISLMKVNPNKYKKKLQAANHILKMVISAAGKMQLDTSLYMYDPNDKTCVQPLQMLAGDWDKLVVYLEFCDMKRIADAMKQVENGDTIVEFCAKYGCGKFMKYLEYECGQSVVEGDEYDLLRLAAVNTNKDVVQYLIEEKEFKVNQNIVNAAYAVSGNTDVCQYLKNLH
eukprot:194110_1